MTRLGVVRIQWTDFHGNQSKCIPPLADYCAMLGSEDSWSLEKKMEREPSSETSHTRENARTPTKSEKQLRQAAFIQWKKKTWNFNAPDANESQITQDVSIQLSESKSFMSLIRYISLVFRMFPSIFQILFLSDSSFHSMLPPRNTVQTWTCSTNAICFWQPSALAEFGFATIQISTTSHLTRKWGNFIARSKGVYVSDEKSDLPSWHDVSEHQWKLYKIVKYGSQ